MSTSLEHAASMRWEKIKGFLQKWPLTSFGTAVFLGLCVGIGIGVYLSCRAMAWRGFGA